MIIWFICVCIYIYIFSFIDAHNLHIHRYVCINVDLCFPRISFQAFVLKVQAFGCGWDVWRYDMFELRLEGHMVHGNLRVPPPNAISPKKQGPNKDLTKGGTIRFPWALRPPDLLLDVNSWQGVLLLEKIIPHFHQSCDRKDWEHGLPCPQDTRSKSDLFSLFLSWVSWKKATVYVWTLKKKRKTGIVGTQMCLNAPYGTDMC